MNTHLSPKEFKCSHLNIPIKISDSYCCCSTAFMCLMLDKRTSSSIYYEDFESDSALTHLNSVDTNICLQSVFSFVLQMAGIVLDLPALTQILQEVPLHQKLNLEPELIQASISHSVS